MKSFEIADIITDKFRETYLSIPPDWHEKGEADLRKECDPTELDWRLRYKFWVVYGQFCNPSHPRYKHTEIKGTAIYMDICSKRHWYDRICASVKKVAFITRPMLDKVKAAEIQQTLADHRIMEALTLSYYDENGKFDHKKAQFVLNAAKLAKNVGGGIFNLNLSAGNQQVNQVNQPQIVSPNNTELLSPEEIEKRLLEIEHEIDKHELPAPNDATIIEAEDVTGTEERESIPSRTTELLQGEPPS